MQIPREIYDTWLAVADKFAFLHKGTDDERREATKRGVQTIRARFRGREEELDGTRWVCKSQHNTGWSAQSKDALAFVEDGPAVTGRLARMEMFDMINGSSRLTNPYPIISRNHNENPPNDNAYILAPDDFDWLAGAGPQPPDSTHMYDGGGNDTDICDICGANRHADIHKIPESFRAHAYDGGEQDTGLCDICQNPIGHALHQGGIEPQPPDSSLVYRVEELERQVVDLTDRVAKLEEGSAGVSEEWVKAVVDQCVGSIAVQVQISQALQSVLRHAHGSLATVTYKKP